jgi:(2Fe-2S) ferredoxin
VDCIGVIVEPALSKFQHHVFVCVNERPAGGKPACGGDGAAPGPGKLLLERLTAGLLERPSLWARVAVTPCGCLGPCFDGPAMVIYPEAIWYAKVAPEDVAEILESHLERGRPVERLLYRWPE